MLNSAAFSSVFLSDKFSEHDQSTSIVPAPVRLADYPFLDTPEHAVFYISDSKGKITHGNSAFAELVAEVAADRDHWPPSFPLDPEALGEIMRRIEDWQVPVIREETITLGNEKRRFRSIHLGLYGQDNKLTGVAGIYQVAESEVNPSGGFARMRERFDDITQLVSDWIWETDSSFRLSYLSPRVTAALGFLPRDLEGKTLSDLGSFDSDAVGQMFDWSEPFSDAPFRIRDRDGYSRLFLMSGLPYYCSNTGAFLGLRGTAREVDEQRLVPACLRQELSLTAKRNGRRDLELERDLRRAIDRDEIHLCFHPLVDLVTGRISGVETLMRWIHPERGQVPPDLFVPIAEATGIIRELGEWVMYAACRQAKTWQDAGLPPVRIGINLSPIQFRQQNLAETVRRVLKETGLDPKWLEFEITEGMIMDQADVVVETMESLRALGVDLTIDDFGTGFSSLAYLQRFPVNRLKIDRSFITNICTNPGDAAITRAVIALAHDLDMKVIGEGVEAYDQFSHLAREGCDEAQGFYFTKPLIAVDMTRWLRARTLLPENTDCFHGLAG